MAKARAKTAEYLLTIVILLLVTGVIVTVYLTRQSQETRSRAVESVSTTVTLTIALQGIGTAGDSINEKSTNNTQPKTLLRPVALELYDNVYNLIKSSAGILSYQKNKGYFTGTIDLGTIKSDTYIVRIHSPRYLKQLLPEIQTLVNGKSHTFPPLTLITGDVNNNNTLDKSDYQVIVDCLADLGTPKNCKEPTKKTNADLTDDGVINQQDLNLFLRNYSLRIPEE